MKLSATAKKAVADAQIGWASSRMLLDANRARADASIRPGRLIVSNQGFDCCGVSHFVGTRRCSSSCQFCTTTIVGVLV